jgi:hypothetical protein
MRFDRVFCALLLPGAQALAQSALDLTGKPDASIKEPFTAVTGVRELPGNRAIVTDQSERTVFLVDFTTGTRRQLGRQGDGPAEYRFPMTPMAAAGNKTWILDATLRRVHVLDSDGSFEASLTPPYGSVPGGLLSARGVDTAGRIYFEGNSFNSETGRFIDSVAVIRWNPANNVTETVGKVWSGGRVIVNREGSTASVARSILPFPQVDAWTALPDGRVAIVTQAPHTIGFLERGGAVRAGPAISHSRIPVTAAERAAYRERHAAVRMTAAGGGQARRAPPISDADFPPDMPPFIASSVTSAANGMIWIGRSHRDADRTWRYDLFDSQGRQAGVATLPTRSMIVGFGRGVVYLARTDPNDDLVYLERHRLR